MALEELKAVALNTMQRPDERWVDNGCIVASAASRQASRSASCGAAQADETAHYMG